MPSATIQTDPPLCTVSPTEHHAQSNKPVRKRQIPNDFAHEQNEQPQNPRFVNIENTLVVGGGKMSGGMGEIEEIKSTNFQL